MEYVLTDECMEMVRGIRGLFSGSDEAAERTPVRTCDDMEHVADLEIHRNLYRDEASERFYWDDGDKVEPAPWKLVARYCAVGYLRYQQDDDKHQLIELLQRIEDDERHRRGEEQEKTRPDKPKPVFSCEGMEHVADLNVHEELYYDRATRQLYWDGGEAFHASWRRVLLHLRAGYLQYAQYGDKRHLMKIIRECKASERPQRAAEREAWEAEDNAGRPPRQGHRGSRIMAVAAIALGIALGCRIARVLSR